MTRYTPTLPPSALPTGAATGDDHVEIDVTDARQGVSGRHILIILGVSMGLVVTALIVVWALNWGDLAAADATETPSPDQAAASAPARP
jgi:hypothetical protein